MALTKEEKDFMKSDLEMMTLFSFLPRHRKIAMALMTLAVAKTVGGGMEGCLGNGQK